MRFVAHIGLVDMFSPAMVGNEASINIVEWGKKGSFDAHFDSKTVRLLHEDLSNAVNRFEKYLI